MKYLIITSLIMGELILGGRQLDAADAAKFDFSLGMPQVIDDSTTTCNNQATIRYDFSLGMPDEVFDATATCTIAGAAAGEDFFIIIE